MPYRLSQQEVAAVSSLPGPQRYEHFVKRAADWEEIWGLANNDGWVIMSDQEGRQCFPFWPHPRYAEMMATDAWNGTEPRSIPLIDLLSKWLPGMDRDGISAAVFPTPELRGVVVDPARLRLDLVSERRNYE